ncbi:MAG: caspase family protein [Oscillatoria sp. PMC 1068.18]|nr:caspase family protein [Oscillatoria sp. PMC 1076.18]MEC4987471.1 caspase family protein [Oscillatoria sp. PMC 1068.18]
MSRFSRRNFLQFAATALGSIGVNHLFLQQQANRYGKVLAQTTSRKVALLVGINQYSSQPLSGCLNDVELQRQLLIHRFGFNPQDIHVLADDKASREGILGAFEEYLIKQVKPTDVVVYHYSGHGSRIFDPNPIIREAANESEQLNGTFVPSDSTLPPGYPDAEGAVNDIMGHTLYLLMSALPTENATVVLDSCFSGGATRDAQVRSRAGGKNVLVSPLEKAYQQQWLSRLQMSPEEFVRGYRRGVAKGVVLAATNPRQLAREVNINGFRAGIFSYLLTNYLWQQDSTVEEAIAKIVPEIPRQMKQTPGYEVKPGTNYQTQPAYFLNPETATADAVVTEVSGNNVSLWLGGANLRNVGSETIFSSINGSGKVIVRSRDGILGQGYAEGVVSPGMLLRQASN